MHHVSVFFYEFILRRHFSGHRGMFQVRLIIRFAGNFSKATGGLGRFVKTRKKCLTPGDEGGLVDESHLESDGYYRVCQFVSWPS